MQLNRAILLALLLLQSDVEPSFHGLSMINLVDLATSESLIATEIEKSSSKLLPLFPYLKNYLYDYRLSRGALDPWGVAGNPIAAYAMISRYFYLLDKLKRDIESRKGVQSELSVLPELLTNVSLWPDDDDLFHVTKNIYKLQYMFDLRPEELVVGQIGKNETGISLSSKHILVLAGSAIEFEEFVAASEWLRLAKTKNISRWEAMWHRLVEKHDENYEQKRTRGHRHLFETPLGTQPDAVSIKYSQMTKWKDATLYELESNPIATHYVNLDLCRKGDVLRGGWKLRGCWYHYDKHVTGPHGPLLPIRVEQLSEEPGLFMFRDYIPLGWIPKLQNYAVPVMRAEPVPPTSDWPAGEPSMANFAWIQDADIGNATSIWLGRKVELTTGLKAVGILAERLKVALYSLVAELSPHYDAHLTFSSVPIDPKNYIDYAATLLIYLNTVERGGSTVFPAAGIAVAPRMGDALYYHLLWRNGTIDKRWVHATCPIPLGVKWTTTKWIRDSENILNRNCDVDRNL